MLKLITLFFVSTICSLTVSAQTTTTATVSATIVEAVGATISSDVFEGRLSAGSDGAGIKTAWGAKFANKDQSMHVQASQKVDVAGFTIIGSSFDYSITLPAEEMKLVKREGNETLTLESFQIVPTKTANKNASYQSVVIQAVCKPGHEQAPGNYFSRTPIEIVINYN